MCKITFDHCFYNSRMRLAVTALQTDRLNTEQRKFKQYLGFINKTVYLGDQITSKLRLKFVLDALNNKELIFLKLNLILFVYFVFSVQYKR